MTDCAHGPVAIVTGGGSGIGASLVVILLRQGCRVALFSERPTDITAFDEHTLAETEKARVSFYNVDVSHMDEVSAAVMDVHTRFGRVDKLANNAGIFTYAPTLGTSQEAAQKLIDVNYMGVWNLIQAVLPIMRAQKAGSIVNVASMAAIHPAGSTAAYAASKGAVVALTRALVPELAKSGVRVNAVLPGPVRTPMSTAFHRQPTPESEAIHDRRMARSLSPHDRAHLEPEDIADVIAFLLSDASRGIQGIALPVADGLGTAMEPFL